VKLNVKKSAYTKRENVHNTQNVNPFWLICGFYNLHIGKKKGLHFKM